MVIEFVHKPTQLEQKVPLGACAHGKARDALGPKCRDVSKADMLEIRARQSASRDAESVQRFKEIVERGAPSPFASTSTRTKRLSLATQPGSRTSLSAGRKPSLAGLAAERRVAAANAAKVDAQPVGAPPTPRPSPPLSQPAEEARPPRKSGERAGGRVSGSRRASGAAVPAEPAVVTLDDSPPPSPSLPPSASRGAAPPTKRRDTANETFVLCANVFRSNVSRVVSW